MLPGDPLDHQRGHDLARDGAQPQHEDAVDLHQQRGPGDEDHAHETAGVEPPVSRDAGQLAVDGEGEPEQQEQAGGPDDEVDQRRSHRAALGRDPAVDRLLPARGRPGEQRQQREEQGGTRQGAGAVETTADADHDGDQGEGRSEHARPVTARRPAGPRPTWSTTSPLEVWPATTATTKRATPIVPTVMPWEATSDAPATPPRSCQGRRAPARAARAMATVRDGSGAPSSASTARTTRPGAEGDDGGEHAGAQARSPARRRAGR